MRFRLSLAVCSLVLIASISSAAEFPEAASLPSQPALPDPLVMLDGTKITIAADWNSKRKPELKSLFQHYMYGFLPPKPQRWIVEEVLFTDNQFLDGKATISESRLAFFGPDLKHRLHVLLVVPNKRVGSHPVFVGMNFCGNHALTNRERLHGVNHSVVEMRWRTRVGLHPFRLGLLCLCLFADLLQ